MEHIICLEVKDIRVRKLGRSIEIDTDSNCKIIFDELAIESFIQSYHQLTAEKARTDRSQGEPNGDK